MEKRTRGGWNKLGDPDDRVTNSWAIHDVAQDFGDLTATSRARLDMSEPRSIAQVALRREKLEKVAQKQVLRLFEVLHGLATQEPDSAPVPIQTILANSYAIGVGFALLPNAETEPSGLNEISALNAIEANPRDWLQLDAQNQRFIYTEAAQTQLAAAYGSDRGCPVVGMRVTNDEGETSSNLLVLYWGVLAAQYT